MKCIFRKYEFPNRDTYLSAIDQISNDTKFAIVELGVTGNNNYSVDILWCKCEQCPELLWDYLYIGESSHEFVGIAPDAYLPEQYLTLE
jgi:hypothetical protein